MPVESPRMRICLNGMWERCEGGRPDRAPASGWKPVRVPEEYGDWARESAWYRLRFNIPEDFAGKRIELEIGRIRSYGKALLNGAVCGESWQMRVPLTADITPHARAGEQNELLVYTHCLAEGYANPGAPLKEPGARGALLDYYDAHDLAAIKGDAFLSCHPAVHISDLHILPSVRRGELSVRARISNAGGRAANARLRCAVRLKGEHILSLPEAEINAAPGQTQEIETAVEWPDPVLWGPPPYGEPALYHLCSELSDGSALVDRRFDRFGFRELWVEDRKFRFNGEPVFLMGTRIGGFEMREVMTLLVPKLQQAGFLFVHPHADNRLQGFYDVCDELGMLVWDGTYCGGPIGNQFGKWGTDRQQALHAALPHLEKAYRGWIGRNRNHPSVAIWSAGCNNEALHGNLRKLIREEDPSRPVVTYDEPETDQEVHMFGFMGWEGTVEDYARGTQNIDDKIANRGEKPYALFIGEYWSQSGQPRAMEITYEKGVAGGCTFDVGGYKGSLPPLHEAFDIAWPSESGMGQRRRNLLLRGHKATYPETSHFNWCDPAKPVFRGDWAEEEGYRRVCEKANRGLQPARARSPEVIVTVSSAGKPIAGEHVILYPEASQSTNPVGVMTDPQGRAWFVLQEAGRYRACCRGKEVAFEAAFQPLKLEPGYGYIQWVELEC